MVSFKMDKQLLRVNEAAVVLNVSRWTIYRWVEEGKLSATRIGKQSLRVIGNSIEKLIAEHRTDS
jgi:excisionase family DNA binding protein